MHYSVIVRPQRERFTLPSIWNLVHELRKKVKGNGHITGRMSLMLPVRIECSCPLESWLVQHRLAELGADWEENFGRRKRCTPWNMREALYLVVKFSVHPGHVRRPCVNWVTQEEFIAMQIPSISGESVLLDYQDMLPHPEAK